jgi:hypothetical protein
VKVFEIFFNLFSFEKDICLDGGDYMEWRAWVISTGFLLEGRLMMF